jgi:hypothetical protein
MSYEVQGLVIPFKQHYLLATGPDAGALGLPLFGPPAFLRPGYKLWGEAEYLLPYTVVDDIGQEYGVPEVYEWLETYGDLFPRSDVLGDLAGGGQRGVVTKNLDLTDLGAFASSGPAAGPFVRLALTIEARAVPDGLALAPVPSPAPLLARALPAYRLAPGVFGAVGAAILNQLLLSRRPDWRLSFDELDEMLGADS